MHDPLFEKVLRYRAMLRAEMPSETRRSLEWLLVSTVREFTGPRPDGTVWGELEVPELVTVANDMLAQAVEITGAQFGNVQLYVQETDTLLMLAHRNFAEDFINSFACLTPDGRTACSRACASRRRVIIEDVANDDLFAPHVGAAQSAGFRAVQSSPLLGDAGQMIGVLSTHYVVPRSFSPGELSRLDSYAGDVSSRMMRAGALS